MLGEFSIPDLLSLLQVDRTHTAIQLSLEADRLCRLRQYKPAIDVAESATELARTDPWLLGETLLYLSYARLCSDVPEELRQATRDCDRAIRALELSTYNYAIANLIRGQMELDIHGVAQHSNALHFFQSASAALEKLCVEADSHNEVALAARYADLKLEAERLISWLASCQALVVSNVVRLDWEHRQELFPHGRGVTKLEQVGLRGRSYAIESLEPGTTGNKFVYLYPEQRYYVVPIYEEGQSPDTPKRFLLVRNQSDTEDPGPRIFVIEPLEPPAPDEPFAHLHIIGGEDDSAATAGIVEAVLTAVEYEEFRNQPIKKTPSIETVQAELTGLEPIAADQLRLPTSIGAIPDLLDSLEVDSNHKAIQLSLEAYQLCADHQVQSAVMIAERASQLAVIDPKLLGETLLYLSYTRLSSSLPSQASLAKRDCSHAIRVLGQCTYEYAIASLIRGLMELQTTGKAGRSYAMHCFENALDALLEELSNEQHIPQPTATRYAILCDKIRAFILEVSEQHIPARELNVFLCHASEDKASVRDLYGRLSVKGIHVWFNEENILGGQIWESEIPRAIRKSHIVIVCVSERLTHKIGYIQKEITLALDVAEEQPEGTIFIIPLRLEDCETPERLRRYQWVNYYDQNGFDKLMLALNERAKSLERRSSN